LKKEKIALFFRGNICYVCPSSELFLEIVKIEKINILHINKCKDNADLTEEKQ
jgi:hypothetical protein